MDEKFLKPYSAAETEQSIYKLWENSGFFNPDVCVEKGITDGNAESFSIVLPPPNVTGTLHIGHAAMLAIEDILVRFNRMRGKRTLWLPGTDHAAIATQEKVEKDLYKKEEKTRHDFGREVFLKRVEDFAQESHDTIVNQIKRMGSSIDWSREAYTLDKARNLAVKTAFKKMYDDDLIYRGHRIVNWDPKLQTTVSDEEIERVEEKTTFYYLKYGPFTISTARPETKFGDKYVVMHPDDKRYAEYTDGQEIELEWINGPIKATVIKDKAVDMEFGTGVMTITPWHDAVDFEIAERHNLDKEQIIDYKGKLLPVAGEFSGMHIKKARPLIMEKLKSKGLVVKTDENYIHNIATDSRGGGIIEPQIMMQWFVDVNKEFKLPYSEVNGISSGDTVTLKKLMIHVVENGQVEIIPDHFSKIYFHWINNLRDWCISRQIWYGHRIPVWYKGDETYTGIDAPEGDGWEQDPDTLDTWFSSGLWTFSTLGWPEKTEDMKNYHPTDVLETGYDILFFWVARMILMSTYLTGQIPFKKVYLHGLVRDGQGRKMSKSLGNIIDPVDMSDKFGTDAVRLSLIIGTAPGNDSKISEDKIRGYKNFANKLWNITRFVLENTEKINTGGGKLGSWQLERIKEFEAVLKEITGDIENYRFYLAGEKLYQYAWHTFADKVIEESKTRLNGTDENEKIATAMMLQEILHKILKVLHPFMPFVTESIWQLLPDSPMKGREILMTEKWPV
jgi:valyl-tRNA synthetase